MKRWTLVEAVPVPGGSRMELYQSGEAWLIRLDGQELMTSRVHGSEQALATLPLAHLPDRSGARVLVGGLGMGFTLAAALQVLPADAEVVVAELVPALVRWNRERIHVAGRPLDDPRVRVVTGDVRALIRRPPAPWSAILLDVDNGPEGLSSPGNAWLYGKAGLSAARDALAPGGVLAVWSAAPDEAFEARLDQAGFRWRAERVGAQGKRGPKHVIWMASRD